MGAIANAMRQTEHVDFKAVGAAARQNIDAIVKRYLPDARRSGSEWECLNPTRGDNHIGSFKISSAKGIFVSDFATGQKGDAIDLVALVTGKSKLDAARELADFLKVPPVENSTSLTGNVKEAPARRGSAVATVAESQTTPISFPTRTPPNDENKPRFVSAGDEGPKVRTDEKRRHVFRQGGVPVRIKIMRREEDTKPFNVYRVATADGVTGWQYAMPADFRSVPYLTADTTPFARLMVLLFWPEGEKDVDTVSKLGEAAFCFGGTGDGLPSGCEQYVAGRDLVILATTTRPVASMPSKRLTSPRMLAARVRVVHFPELSNKQDVSDWFLLGHVRADLLARVEATADWTAAKAPPDEQPKPQDDEQAT